MFTNYRNTYTFVFELLCLYICSQINKNDKLPISIVFTVKNSDRNGKSNTPSLISHRLINIGIINYVQAGMLNQVLKT